MRYDAENIYSEFGRGFRKFGSEVEAHRTPWSSDQEFVYRITPLRADRKQTW